MRIQQHVVIEVEVWFFNQFDNDWSEDTDKLTLQICALHPRPFWSLYVAWL